MPYRDSFFGRADTALVADCIAYNRKLKAEVARLMNELAEEKRQSLSHLRASMEFFDRMADAEDQVRAIGVNQR